MIKILGRASAINVRKVLWTCAELGVDYEREDWGLGFRSPSQPEFLALNPNATVPVLVDGDFTLWQSNAICRYLNDKFDGPLLGDTRQQRALIEQWMDWQAMELNTAWRYTFLSKVRQSPDFQDPGQLQASIASWTKLMGILDRQLQASGRYVLGDQFTLADVVMGLSVNRWLTIPFDKPDYSSVLTYYELLREREGFLTYGCNGIA
ncbi:MAG: glutathione S-transferase [Burkholderiaceae bacterium]|nr:glutathione S-transferase [Burkholderiaceae bacterium]